VGGPLSVALDWNTLSDLDLHVTVPIAANCSRGATLNFRNKTGCGGQLDVDQNLEEDEAVETPVEHVAWRSAAPPGKYTVEVSHYKYRGPRGRDTTTEFRVEIWMDGRLEKSCKGRVRQKEKTTLCWFEVKPRASPSVR
jgi:hypothetical protein